MTIDAHTTHRSPAWPIEGMVGAGGARTLAATIARLPGVLAADANFATSRMRLDPARMNARQVADAIRTCGFDFFDRGDDATLAAAAVENGEAVQSRRARGPLSMEHS